MQPEAVVFDLDGTLMDSAPDIRSALNRTLARHGYAPVELEAVRLMIGGGPELLVARALESLGVDPDGQPVRSISDEFEAQYRRHGNHETTLTAGALELLRFLARERIPTGLCSNKPEHLCRAAVDDLELQDYFDVVRGSGNGLPRKPQPDVLLATIEAIGASNAGTIYVGDSETDVATARAAGVDVAVVSFGYTDTPAGRLGADWVVDDLRDIPAIWTTA